MKTSIFALCAFGAPALAETVYIAPGQCILVGGTQVCALEAKSGATTEQKPFYICRYDLHRDTEISDLKSYALLRVQMGPDGKQTEISVKNFGINGKEACNAEAEKRNAAPSKN